MRSLLAFAAVAIVACSTDEFSSTSDAGADGASAQPISIVNASSTLTTSDDPIANLVPSPKPGNAVIVVITCFSEVDNCSIPNGAVTDVMGNAYRRVVEGTSITSSSTHGTRGYIFIAEDVKATAAPFTISIDPNGSPGANVQHVGWAAFEVAGLLPSNSTDLTASTAAKTDPTTTVATTGPTAQANELAIALHYMRSNDADVAYGTQAGWNQSHFNANGVQSVDPFSIVTRILDTKGVVSHTWTHHAPTRSGAAILATFKGRSP